MGLVCRAGRRASVVLALSLLVVAPQAASAQFPGFFPPRFELSDSVHLDGLDSAAKQHLERARALLASGQWDDAVETLRQVMERQGERVVAVTPWRYTSVREHCHLLISRLPAAALALYRSRVDGQAEKWYTAAVADRDSDKLINLVDQMFCSTWADEALLALGDLALEQGEYDTAAQWWAKLIETPPLDVPSADFERLQAADDLPADDVALLAHCYGKSQDRDGQFYVLRVRDARDAWSDTELMAIARVFREHGQGSPRLAYPGTDIDFAEIRVRQVLAKIFERSPDAGTMLREFSRQYPEARGRLAGRDTNFAEGLTALLVASASWPVAKPSPDWTTFAGSPERNKHASGVVELGQWKWKLPLPKLAAPDSGPFARRVAEDRSDLLSYHPVVADGLLLLNNQNEIYAYDLHTGAPAWGGNAVFADLESTSGHASAGRSRMGVPRYTMTIHDRKLYARMGSPATSTPNDQRVASPSAQSYLLCLDIAREGSALWDSRQSFPLDEKWSFEGSPICDGPNLYVGMRRSDVHPQAHVACLDAQSGKLRWRRWVCSAETPAQGLSEEITHNLLTLHGGTLYYNTNLGAVAALSARDGQIQWLRLYPRSPGGDRTRRAAHFYRDLTPCVYDHGYVYVAPSDASRILALDAGTGELRWETTLAEDTIHMLGVCEGKLIATGDKIWWFNVVSGKPVRLPWPLDKPAGFGRGAIVDNLVFWPTRERVHVFDARTCEESRQPIELVRAHNAQGGNIIVADNYLLVVASDTLYAFEQTPPPKPPDRQARAPMRARSELVTVADLLSPTPLGN